MGLDKRVSILVNRIHYFSILSAFKVYLVNLKYICAKLYFKLYKINNVYYKIQCNKKYSYCLCIDAKEYIRESTFFRLLKKSCILQDFTNLLSHTFKISPLKNLKLYLSLSNSYLFLSKNKYLQYVIEIIVLHFYYEFFILLDNNLSIDGCKPEFLSFYNNYLLFFLCTDLYEWTKLKKKIIEILSCEMSRFKAQDMVKSYFLYRGIFTDSFVAYVNYKCSYLNFIFIPSLRSQFLLMKQISLILHNAKSLPPFLFVIRLNMLIILWSYIYLNRSIKKIIYLFDYLLNLKLRNMCKFIFNDKSFHFKLSKKRNDGKYLNLRKNHRYFFTIIYHNTYYKSYCILKLNWLYYLEFSRSLREAI